MSGESPQRGLRWSLQIREERCDSVVVLALAGRVGALSAGTLAATIAEVMAQGCRRLVIDLAQVDYLSSAGFDALQAAANHCAEADGALVLCAVAEPVRIVLELAGLLPRFSIEASRERAILRASLNSS